MKEEDLGILMAEIIDVKKVEKTDRLFHVTLKSSDRDYHIATSLASFYKVEELIGKQVPIKVNVEIKTMFGITSNARFIAILNNKEPVLLVPEARVKNGAPVI
ncbi:hypothetical protein [Saccharospirillum salsuginis]|uniref:tRNA-binding domain-containing protein n=1 Tax=Saccharospirillum salsuginis TaxID=418750 RepID=A0A918KBW8_9GAMM|nr:hypothetical protein [Saccharospirillum salsuginis]GGX57358.1 hypothetical protein GCM10007392_26150 [Saccharospirillum salsuginis]